MNVPILYDILIVLSLSVVMLLICHRFWVPLIIGLIVTGILGGPHGLKLIKAEEEVKIMAEIGVALLLFTIGLEFSFRKLFEIKKIVLLGGILQVSFTFAVGFTAAYIWASTLNQAAFIGLLIALSSTAIVLKLLKERSEIESPHGRVVLGILLFQDLALIPILLLMPMLAGETQDIGRTFFHFGLKCLGILVFAYVGAKYLVPKILYLVMRTRNREIVILCILALCLAIAELSHMAGLSFALGAFLAGLVISESEYSHHALAQVLPFRDVFTSFFFISIGMLLDLAFLVEHIGFLVCLALGIMILKMVLAGIAAALLKLPLRPAILTGFALAQIGEFSFILAETGLNLDLISDQTYQYFLSTVILTMISTPVLIRFSPPIATKVSRAVRSKPSDQDESAGDDVLPVNQRTLQNHIIIIGYGWNGRNLARAAKWADIPYVILEMNPQTVKQEKAKGEPIFFGDATHTEIMEKVHIHQAAVLVVAINDTSALKEIITLARSLHPQLHILARTRYVSEAERLIRSGADEVIPEEFETSVEIFSRILRHFQMPPEKIDELAAKIRSERRLRDTFRDTSLLEKKDIT